MPRPRKEPDKWKSPRTKGAVHNRDGFAVMRFNGNKRACGLKFHPDNQRACLEMLEKWVMGIQFPELTGVRSPQTVEVPSLFGAIDQFESARYPALGHRARKNYDRAFSFFGKRDVPLDYRNLVDLVVERNQAAMSPESGEQLAHNTRHKYLQYLKAFFDWVVEQEWLKKNPIDVIGLPRREAKKDILVYARKEVDAITEKIRETPGHEDYALLIELLALTGLRIGEALGLRWVDISDREIRVMSAKGGKPRVLPVKLIPGLAELARRIKKTMDGYATKPPGQRRRHSSADHVFWWIDATDPRSVFNAAKADVGLSGDGRTLHTLRGTAEWWWENELRWEERTICDVAGHTSGVRHGHYRVMPTVEELEGRQVRR